MTQELIVSVASAAASLFVAFCSFLVSFLKTRQANKETEAAKLKYAEAVLNGCYLICPDCGRKIELKDIHWYQQTSSSSDLMKGNLNYEKK